jgi:hypothetical protein
MFALADTPPATARLSRKKTTMSWMYRITSALVVTVMLASWSCSITYVSCVHDQYMKISAWDQGMRMELTAWVIAGPFLL